MSKRAFLPLALSLFPLAACVVSLGGSSCAVNTLHGSGVAATQARTVPAFSRVEVNGSAAVVAKIGDATALSMTGDDNLLAYVTTEVRGDTLVIAMQPGRYDFERDLVVEFGTPRLESFAVHGSSNAQLSGFEGGALALAISGSGRVRAGGRVDSLHVSISGSGDMQLEELEARQASIAIAGSGDVRVHASESLDVSISGSGNVRYRGQPAINQRITGSGSISQR
jgi:Putative auto-transporter adhesin, head GIN domain